MSDIRNKKIINIHLDQETYMVEVVIDKDFVDGWDEHYFVVYQRNTNNHVILQHNIVDENDTYFVIQISVAAGVFLTEGDVFDLSIVRKREDEETRSRIKSNFDQIEFLQVPIDDERIFYPSTTNQGNISFYIQENFLQAKFEKVELSNGALLSLIGLFRYQDLHEKEIHKIELLASSDLNEEIIHVPVQLMQLPDQYKKYGWYPDMKSNGFRAEIDLKLYLSLGIPQYMKFHLKIEIEHEIIESKRIRVNHLTQQYPLNQKVKKEKNTFKITCKPTKQSKYFSVRMAEFKLPAEIVRELRRNWIALRRSKQLLKLYKVAFFILGLVLPVDKKLVMFESFHGKQFSDNPRALYEYMQKNNSNYQLIWSVDRRHEKYFSDKDVDYVRRFSIRWLLLMSRAKYWVTNARLPLWIPKPRHTTYLQTWHGTPLKRLATDMEDVHMPGTDPVKYKMNFTKEAAKWDYLISPNAYSTEVFRRAFQFNKDMIESGYPRNDYLFNSNNEATIKQLKQKMEIPADKKIILYAPTWRDNQFFRKGSYKFDLALDLDRLLEEFGDSHVVVLRMHYLIAENLNIDAHEGFVYDFSKYEDIRDLYLVSDILITDYSSVFFDYANLRRPIIFFVYDIDDYRDNLRGFYFDFERKSPGPLSKTSNEVIAEIKKVESEFIPSADYEEFYQRFCYLEDGNASERVVKKVFS